jgi:hypothetical protein
LGRKTCTLRTRDNDEFNRSQFSGVVEDAYEVYSTLSRQFRVDDDKLIRYVSQYIENLFGPPNPVDQPALLPKELYNEIAKAVCFQDYERTSKVQLLQLMLWILHTIIDAA